MIDYDFEDRLIERIDARKLIAARLNPRQKHMLCRAIRYGETLREIGEPLGIGGARVGQIVNKAWDNLTNSGVVEPFARAPGTPPGFNNAEFTAHMRGLIKARVDADAWAAKWEAEREAERAAERAKPPPPPPPPPRVWSTPADYQPSRIYKIALYVLGYFRAARNLEQFGLLTPGTKIGRIECERDDDAIAAALMKFARELPPTARLSAYPLQFFKEPPMACAESPFMATRVIASADGRRLAIEMTWDD